MLTIEPTDRLAYGLAKLATPALDDSRMLISMGHAMRITLEWAVESENGLTEEFSYLSADKLMGLGLIERACKPGKHWLYRLTDEGKRFMGVRRNLCHEPSKGWVMLCYPVRDGIHIDLTNLEHLRIMARLLDAGWELPSRRQHGDTDKLPAVRL